MELTNNEKILANLGDDLLHRIQICKKAIKELEEFMGELNDYDEAFSMSNEERNFRKIRNKLYKKFRQLDRDLEKAYEKAITNKKTTKTG